MINIKRIYEPYDKGDGYRILVDRLWPRGVSKEKAKLDQWLKDIGPSGELRKWFGHEPDRWLEFKKRYKKELSGKKDLLNELKAIYTKHKKLTLLYGAKDEKHNEAVILVQMIRK